MQHTPFRTWSFVAALGLVATACSDNLAPTSRTTVNPPAYAIVTTLTSAGGPAAVGTATGGGDGYWWTQYTFEGGSVGTGNLKPFLRVQHSPTEDGFNTDATNQDDNKDGQWTHSLQLNRIPQFTESVSGGGSGPWRELFLDANESNSDAAIARFSIDRFDLYICGDGTSTAPKTYTRTQFDAAKGGLCTLAYTLNGDAAVGATDALTQGSGNLSDYRMLIPASAFGTANAACPYTGATSTVDCHYYVILDVRMGHETGWNTDATFEELSTLDRPVPPDLHITKTPDAQTVAAGNNITFTISLTNTAGMGDATGVTISDPLPNPGGSGSGIDWSTSSPNCSITGSPPSETLNCNVGTLTGGSTFNATVTSATTGNSCGVYNNTATFNSTNASTGSDAGQITVNNCTGTIIIKKYTDPAGSSQSFGYTSTGGLSPSTFNLTDTGTQTFSGVSVGSYTVTESALSGWDLIASGVGQTTACVLTSGTAGGSRSLDVSTRTASITLGLGQTVTCTFVNRQRATLRIIKETLPDGNTQLFTFTPGGYESNATFQLKDNDPAHVVSNLVAGAYTTTETPVGGYQLTNRTCALTGGGAFSNYTTTTANQIGVTLAAGQDVTCTFQNTKLATVRFKKVTDPAGNATPFTFTPSSNLGGGATFTRAGNQGTQDYTGLLPGTYSAAETPLGGWSLTNRTCALTAGGAHAFTTPTNGLSVVLTAGEDVTCTFTNTQKATLIVTKTTVPTSTVSFNYDRFGCTGTSGGWFTGCAVAMPSGVSNTFSLISGGSSTTDIASVQQLTPGSYRVCERGITVGSYAVSATLDASTATFEPVSAGVGDFCVDVQLAPGQTRTVAYTNTLPGGGTRTIGYWKNWSSCTNGKQYEKATAGDFLDKTLDWWLNGSHTPSAGPGVYPFGTITNLTCDQAVLLLSKSDLNGVKRASDAAYNMAAQLLAAILNYAANAGTCTAATNAITDGKALLVTIGFNGVGPFLGKGSTLSSNPSYSAWVTSAMNLAGILGSYNEGTLGGGCPTHAS